MRDYLKCVVANRFTFAGFVTLPFTLLLFVVFAFDVVKISPLLGAIDMMLILCAIVCLGGTSFGVETLKAYQRTKGHIAKHGTLCGNWASRYNLYCGRAGVSLAAKGAMVENPYRRP